MSDALLRRLEALRVAILRTHDKEAGKRIDGLLLSDLVNIGYVAGFTGSSALALIMPDRAYLITDSRYTIQARAECPHFEVVISQASAGTGDLLVETLNGYEKGVRIGFETSASYANVTKLQDDTKSQVRWRPATPLVEKLRAIKDADEIAAIRAAIVVAQEAFAEVAPLLVPGTVERDYALALETAMRKRDAQRPSFDTIVASGPNGALPHYTPGTRAFQAGELVTIDWGAELDGYCSDITRTVVIPGAPLPEKLREIYAVVLEAKERATAAIKPGVTGKVIDAIARDYITEQGYGDYFGHSLGHQLGRVVHDGPALSTRSEKLTLRPGMVTTVEPGIYIEGVGGVRVEEDVLVTADGYEVLTVAASGLGE